MRANEQSLPINGFGGLDKSGGASRNGVTRSLLNVTVREATAKGRGGVDFNATFGTAMAEEITALAPYVASTLATTLLRIGSTKIEKSTDAGAWSDITGTDLTGAATDKPQWVMFRDVLYFTNSGQDRPRYWNGSSNTVEISTAPWAHSIMSYMGFLFLLNISDDGSTFFPRTARYSEDPQNDWTLCEGNELNFHETQGAVVAGCVFGRTAVILKEDGVAYLRWIGGPVRFAQELAKNAPGTLAPLSAQAIGDKGCIYLGTDYELYIASTNDIIPVAPKVNDILQNDLHRSLVKNCRSCVLPDEEQYNLFFPLDNSGNTGRIQMNYRTGEFSYSTYPSHAWDAMEAVRWTFEDPFVPIGAAATRTYTLDVQAVKTDEITATTNQTVSRYYDTDWLQYANANEGRVVQSASDFTGATFIFTASAYAKCSISVAVDHQDTFRFRKTYSLRPVKSADAHVAIRYDLPPVHGQWFNVRIEFHPNATENPTVEMGWLHFVPAAKRDINRGGKISEAA